MASTLSAMNAFVDRLALAAPPASPPPSAGTPRTGAQVLLDTLVALGVDTLFGYPGGAVLPLYDALHGEPRLRHILVRHEQAGGHAADGYARASGKLGCALATSGPGATNLVTAIASSRRAPEDGTENDSSTS